MYSNRTEASAINSASSIQEVPSSYQVATDYFTFATTVLLIWHYVLAIDEEVMFFWTRRYSGACVLFFANRYLSLGRAIYAVSPWNTNVLHHRQCAAKGFTFLFLEVLQYAVWAVFSSLRVYALRRQWVWAGLVFLLSLFPILASAGVILRSQGSSVGHDTGCTVTIHGTATRSEWIVVIFTRAGLIVSDAIVVAITWMSADTTCAQDVFRAIGRAKTLSSVMYKNGALYFLASTTLNGIVLILYLITCTSRRASSRPGLSMFANFAEVIYDTFSAILTTNFLIRLQEAAHASARVSSNWPSQSLREPLSVLQFARADVDSWARETRSGPFAGDDDVECAGWADASTQMEMHVLRLPG